ncbi:hypothetical protein [Gallaecimonas pentaromativorans]|uniref:hypothetical protein n=1 Tax=Gallaecimonas pentaromativorans TaxID=584787 RepID=UPI001475F3F9|nr:hypothetical protein [Gallaecimonas pentaromativorans]
MRRKSAPNKSPGSAGWVCLIYLYVFAPYSNWQPPRQLRDTSHYPRRSFTTIAAGLAMR